MSYVFPSDQDRADDELLNEACERIEELMDQLASKQVLEGDPIAWMTEGGATISERELLAWTDDKNGPTRQIFNLPLYTHPASSKPLTLGQRKAAQVGQTIGVLVQNKEGRVCAVTDLGRCTWLSEDVTGAGDRVHNCQLSRAIDGTCFSCGSKQEQVQ